MICLRHLFTSREITIKVFFSKKRPAFLHICAVWSELSSNISTMILFCMYDGECKTLCCRNKKWRNFLFSRMYWGWTPIHYCPDPVKLCPQNLPNSDKKKSFLQANTWFFSAQIYIVYIKNPNSVWELDVFSFNQPNIISLAAMEWK